MCLIKKHATQKKMGMEANAPCILTLAVNGGIFTPSHLIPGVTRAVGWVGLRDGAKILVLSGDKPRSPSSLSVTRSFTVICG